MLSWDNDVYAQGGGDSVTMETPRLGHRPCPQEASIRAAEENLRDPGGSQERGTGPFLSLSEPGGHWSRGEEVSGETAALKPETTA